MNQKAVGWIGSRIYSTGAYYEGNPVDLILVPFADAGQAGGDIRVWIKKNRPIQPKKKQAHTWYSA